MEQYFLAVVATLTAVAVTDVSSLQCYQCHINPPLGSEGATKRLCVHFDGSSDFVVDCPYSTMCMKQTFHLDIQNGVRVTGELRDCAPQQHKYQYYENSKWHPAMEILEPYDEGCQSVDDKGERATSTRYCYCRGSLCNSSTSNTEGYTDIMAIIMVFNMLKYIRSLR